MKLNIYEKKKIVKTYTADTYDLMWGTIEDIADAIKLDQIKTGSQEELAKLAFNLVVSGRDTVNYLMSDIFDGITEEELRGVKVSEIVDVLVEVVRFTVKQLNMGIDKKN